MSALTETGTKARDRNDVIVTPVCNVSREWPMTGRL